jgi:hypothetical protein
MKQTIITQDKDVIVASNTDGEWVVANTADGAFWQVYSFLVGDDEMQTGLAPYSTVHADIAFLMGF